LEIITDTDPLISPEVRFFHQPTQQLQTISSNIESVSNDYVIVLPGDIPVVGQVLTAIDVDTVGNSVTVHTGWSTVSSNGNTSANVNVDIMGLYAANTLNLQLNGTWMNVNSWVTSVSSPAISLQGNQTTLRANFPSKVNGSVKVGFQSLGSIGSRNVRVVKNGTPISLVTQQPNPNRSINTFVTVPFFTQLAANDNVWVQVQYLNNTTNGYPVTMIPGQINTLMGINIVY
jgi:hypothetical protein